jgi:hypothetical protein
MFQVALIVGGIMMLSMLYILTVWSHGRRKSSSKGHRGSRIYYR